MDDPDHDSDDDSFNTLSGELHLRLQPSWMPCWHCPSYQVIIIVIISLIIIIISVIIIIVIIIIITMTSEDQAGQSGKHCCLPIFEYLELGLSSCIIRMNLDTGRLPRTRRDSRATRLVRISSTESLAMPP